MHTPVARRRSTSLVGRFGPAMAVMSVVVASCTGDAVSTPDDPVDATVVAADESEAAVVESTTPASDNAAGSDREDDASGISGLVVRPVLETLGFEPGAEPPADEVGVRRVLLGRDGETYVVGPAPSGRVFASAVVTEELGVGLLLTLDGPDGADAFNEVAGQCFSMAPTCPTGQLAIVFDDVVLTAPTVQTPTFDDTVSVTGQFTLDEAEALADSINDG